ncbi:MAG TPA: class I SAM-dependent methyltransferase [Anaeromyxobacteraceae bacterium]|nr:class I SAM-dependent methyltransferase [Anaeromyxobacteraceae bacterium]
MEADLIEVAWQDASGARRDVWLSPGAAPPERASAVGDRTTAAEAIARARGGEGLVYAGDYHNARQLLSAMARRLARGHRPGRGPPISAFRADRVRREEEARVLSRLVIPLAGNRDGWTIALRRAPDVAQACEEALGPAPARRGLLPLRDLLGIIGAHEWRRRGVAVAALNGRVHPHYGVYAPVRSEYVDLVAEACTRWPPAGKRVLDVGTGTGVLAILLALRGAAGVVACDLEARAVACARENATRFGVEDRVRAVEADLFPGAAPDDPAGPRYDLVVCNPPWIPGAPHGPLDRAVYDPDGSVLERFGLGLRAHLAPQGEGWLVLSDLAERAGLRRPGHVTDLAARGGLQVADAISTRPRHPRAKDAGDPLHALRAAETTSLYRLVRA